MSVFYTVSNSKSFLLLPLPLFSFFLLPPPPFWEKEGKRDWGLSLVFVFSRLFPYVFHTIDRCRMLCLYGLCVAETLSGKARAPRGSLVRDFASLPPPPPPAI